MSAQRTAFAYGATSALPHARICGWCREAMSERDRHLMEQGAQVTHGICPACEARLMADEQRYPDPERRRSR